MDKSKIKEINERIEKGVVEGYKKIEDGVVEGYKKIEKGAVEGFEKVNNGMIEKIGDKAKDTVDEMAEDVKYAYDKVESAVVEKFEDITDSFIEKHLMKEGETLEEAKARIAAEQAERTEKTNSHANVEVKKYNHEEAMKAQKEMIEKSIEASKNAGNR